MEGNTLAKPGRFDALEKLDPDALFFPLVEHDLDAPPTIFYWVDRRRKRSYEITDPEKLKAELQQCTDAEMIAIEMIARQKGQNEPAKAGPAQTYSGIVREKLPIDELMIRLRAELGEADFHAHNALELGHNKGQPEFALDSLQYARLAEAARLIHALALELSPHRAAYLAEGELPLQESSDG